MVVQRNLAFPLEDPYAESEKVNLYRKKQNKLKTKEKRLELLSKFTVHTKIPYDYINILIPYYF